MRVAIIYLLAITAAELMTITPQPVWGIVIHIIILLATLLHPAIASEYRHRRLVLSLALVPLIRIVSLSLPIANIPQIWWYPIIYIPIMVAAITAARILGYKASDIGLTLKVLPLQIAISLLGFLLGITEYLILRPEPIISVLSWREVWLPALILLTCTGFVEEFVFRGVLQQTGLESFGWRGIIYVSLLFAILHVGFLSWVDVVFVFSVALLFGWIVKKTGSLFGVTLTHGITNITLFLLAPFFF